MSMAMQARATAVRMAIVLSLPALACATPGPSHPATSQPRDTVTTAYGSTPRARLTDAVGSLGSEELATMRVARVEDMLRGRIPGVEVMRDASGQLSVRIRGASAFNAVGAEPLFVIDGMPVRGGGLSRVLDGLSPTDIARIDVLKDAGALAAYGLMGANGAILITTKRRVAR
jgi:TonB-dependent SusC/RagA subfamily outer membrane receptor